MVGPTAQLAALLLVVAAGNAGASMVTMMEEGKLTFCGKQACFAPNVCLPFLGVNVCVRTNTPKCSDIKCPPKHECALLQDVCDTLPCHPKAYCVKHNPCGICLSPDHFCELLPTPVCRHVVEPTCLNKKCGFGEMCKKEPLECAYPPCRVKFSCASTWPYHYASDGEGSSKNAAGVATKKAGGAVSALGGVFNAFNGFNADVEKAFIAGPSPWLPLTLVVTEAPVVTASQRLPPAPVEPMVTEARAVTVATASLWLPLVPVVLVATEEVLAVLVVTVSPWLPLVPVVLVATEEVLAVLVVTDHYSDNRFGFSHPVSHAAGVVNAVSSVDSSAGGKTDVQGGQEPPAEQQAEEEEEGDPSESDTEDEDEEEEPDQAL
ncbi:hypothetical protein FJT64_014809 [Amphibalanus amphitrite]|uniref:Uncharacterized protein n=1 Tax=Amphibalanus amphitrite TaxID=1232801 RepID=A0A6A4V7N9_AMPAM|nr:hypothetical protein FJT64_014809 [Amphibalanus amphitrite]